LLAGLDAATAVAGPLIAKTGRYKIYPVIGAVLTGAAMGALSFIGAGTAGWAIITAMIFAGAGVGLFVQVSLLAGQNAAEYRDLGAATGALNFFKSVGGAFGAALFGAILAHALPGGPVLPANQCLPARPWRRTRPSSPGRRPSWRSPSSSPC
jgi:MFS family permease